jgi:rod shape determining protein RodA
MKHYRPLRLGDPVLFVLVVALSLFGIAMIYSAGVVDVPGTRVEGTWRAQLLWFCIAMLLVPLILRIPVGVLEWGAQPVYALALVLLIAALVMGEGSGTAASTKSWLRIGPVGMQPAELAKIATALMLARVLGEWREAPRTLWALWKPIAVVAVPMGLVMLQPDLGSALAFAFILVWALYWAGTPLLTVFFLVSPLLSLFLSISVTVWGVYVVALLVLLVYRNAFLSEKVSIFVANAAAGAIALPLWNMLQPYQKARFMVFLDPSIDPRGSGYNLIQSRVAIGSGGLWGKGWLEGPQKRLAFLPEQHTDFIFSVIGEELGFVGVVAVLLCFGLIFWRMIRIAERSRPVRLAGPDRHPGELVRARADQRGDDGGRDAGDRHSAPFLSYGGSFLLVNLWRWRWSSASPRSGR